MTKEDRARLFADQSETAEEPERVTGEAIPPEATIDGLPVDIRERIDNAIYDFCMYECKPPIEDLSKARAPKWAACCDYIGRHVCKPLLREAERGEGGRWKPYSDEIIAALLPLWGYYCQLYEKAPFKQDFSAFAGMGLLLIESDMREVTPARAELCKKISKMQENGLAGLISDGSRNPTGALAILNHWHGWAQNNVNVTVEAKRALSAASLPALGTIAETEQLPTLPEINNSSVPVETI